MKNGMWSPAQGVPLCLLLILSLWANAAATTHEKNGYHYDVVPPPAWVKPATVPMQWDANTPGAGGAVTDTWRTWLDDVQVDRRNGTRETYIDQVYEPLTTGSLAEAGRYQFAFIPEFESLSIHRVEVWRDGKWSTRLDPDRITLARREADFESDMATGTVTALLDLPDIRVGDRIRITYTIKGSNPVLAGLDGNDLTVGWVSPLLERRLRVLFDKAAAPEIRRAAGIPAGTFTTTDTAQEYVETEHGLPGVRDEGDTPDWFSPHPREQIAEKHTWADIANWAVTLYPAPKPLPADLMQRIAQWKREPDQATRVAKALHAVQDEVRYFGIELGENSHRPAEPADVWTHRQGDCKDKARLLVAILAQMEIAAQPALVSSKGGPELLNVPPSASVFDHVIVRVQLGDRSYWLDPTRTQQRGSLEQAAVSDFGHALVVAPGSLELVPVVRSAGSAAKWRFSEIYSPSADGKSTRLDVVTKASGFAAEQLRRRFANNTREKIQKDYAEYYSRAIAGLDKVEPLQMEDDADGNIVTTHESYVFTGALVPEDNLLTLPTYAEGVGDYLKMPSTINRRDPLEIANPVDVEQRIVLNLPPQWKWRGEPFQKTIDSPGLHYSLETSEKENQVLFLNQFHSTQSVIELPQMAEHLAGRREVNDLVNRRFLMTGPVAIAPQQRDARLRHLLKDIMDASEAGMPETGKPDTSNPDSAKPAASNLDVEKRDPLVK